MYDAGMSVEPAKVCVERIVSGGQTGVDRGALQAAIELGIPHGGWCPRGRRAEDGVISRAFDLTETESSKYWVRTEKNVIDSDGTLILVIGALSGGTELTYRMAIKHGKPHLVADLRNRTAMAETRRWLGEHQIRSLNVAGPRESSARGITRETQSFITALLQRTD